MEGHTKIFLIENDKLSDEINKYIKNYKLKNFINLIPINTTVIRNIKPYNYLMIPRYTEVLVSFEKRKLSNEEIVKVKNILETNAIMDDKLFNQFNIRKNEVTGEIMFWFVDKYYNIYDIFDIQIIKDLNKININKNLFKPLPSIFYKYLRNKKEWYYFTYENVLPKLEKILL